jgi:transposase
VTSECSDWGLLEAGISGAKEAAQVETLEGIADKGYGCDEVVLKCLLNGDTPTIYPNKNQNCRTFKFDKIDDEITSEMLASSDHKMLQKCLSAGVLPDVLKERGDITLEIVETTVPSAGQFLNTETGEIVSFDEMRAAGGCERKNLEIHCESPVSPYFERDIEADTITCPMGQTLFYAGPGQPNGQRDDEIRRYHRLSVCQKCPNKCTTAKRRIVSFKPDEMRIYEHFYDDCMAGRLTQKANRTFTRLKTEPLKKQVVVLKYYPNQHKLRIRNQVVEHPYGTVKRWNDGYYLLVKGRLKAAAELALSFLGYNMKRAINVLGTEQLLLLMGA